MRSILAIFLSILCTTSIASPLCQTHQICAIDTVCRCTISPDYNQRNFYLEFANIDKGHLYQCDFSTTSGHAAAILDNSTFPVGTIWQLQNTSAYFPFTVTLDTNSMETASEKVSIKYFVGPSDISTDIIASCIRVA